MKQSIALLCLAWVCIHINSVQAADWNELSGKPAAPRLIAFNNSEKHPDSIPFISMRKQEVGFWTSFDDAALILKIGQTTAKSDASATWEDTGMWMHLLAGSEWIALPVYESPGAAAGAVKSDGDYFTLQANFWKNIQATRPPAKTTSSQASGTAAKTGAFTANLGEYGGTAMTPDDRKANPLYKYKGDPAAEEADVVVPADYDGTKPFGLMVYITPGRGGSNSAPTKWEQELASHQIIWIGPRRAGNDQVGERRVWMAQQARAWALHHYRIDPARTIISGFSNGADAASATAVATPFGFSNAILFAPPCEPPVGPVHVPRESDHSVTVINPLSGSGLSHIKKNWRIAYVVGIKDQFLSNVRSSAKAVDGFKMGGKLYEIDGLGHDAPSSIAGQLDFIDAPGDSPDASERGFSADPYLADIRRAIAASPARGRSAMIQLWENHPEARTHPDVLALLAKMEALP